MSDAGKGDTYRPVNRVRYNENFEGINWKPIKRYPCGCLVFGIEQRSCPFHEG